MASAFIERRLHSVQGLLTGYFLVTGARVTASKLNRSYLTPLAVAGWGRLLLGVGNLVILAALVKYLTTDSTNNGPYKTLEDHF